MKRKKSKWLRFVLGMVIYALVVLLIACVGLKFLWDFADEYERSLPMHKINEYVASLNEAKVKKISIDFVSTLDKNIQSEEEAYAEIWKCFVGGVQYQQISTDSSANSITYLIRNREHELGRVTLVKNGDALAEKTWSVGNEEYDFSFLLNSDSFIVPEYWVVRVGERRLGVQYIVDPRVEYSFLGEFYNQSFPMPYLAEYEIDNYIGDPEIRFYDADGNEQTRFTLTDGRDQMPRVSGRSYDTFVSFAEDFIPLYVNCLSNVSKNAGTNYQRLRPYLVPDSELDQRIQAAFGGQAFAQSRGTQIRDIQIHDVYNLGMEYFIVDLSYTVDTYSDKGLSTSDTDMYLVVFRDDETLQALMVSLY